METQCFNQHIEDSIRANWDLPALSDYKGATYHYKDVARRIEKIHIIFEKCGLHKGDKVALAGRNSSNWGIAFLATLTYGAVAIPILHEFKPDGIHHIVNHSDARILFAGDVVWESLNESMMLNLEAVVLLPDFSIVYCRKQEVCHIRGILNELFGKKYPDQFRPEDVNYYRGKNEELALISYTSGTTGVSKGVMLPYRSLLSNLLFAKEALGKLAADSNLVAMLPMAHMYGLMFEFLFEVAIGCHVHFLTRLPTPKIILEAFAEVKPNLIISVPLIIEKIYKKQLKPILEKPAMKLLLKLPIIDQHIEKKINDKLQEVFGGNFFEIVIGGAPLNHEVERVFKSLGFNYTVGYGMTECGPIISYDSWETNRLFSCGRTVPRMTIRIDSPDPEHIDGEILVKGDNVMDGYYKNPEATTAAIDKDGWLHTGDMGIMDSDGYLYIRGRSKNMILGPSGQNIYPEEIEDMINATLYAAESLVIEENGKLVALVYPDFDAADRDSLRTHQLEKQLADMRDALNQELPQYSQLAEVRLYPEEFEKTPKRSIKRYLYQTKR